MPIHGKRPSYVIVDDPENIEAPAPEGPEVPEEHELLLDTLDLFHRASGLSPDGYMIVSERDASALQRRISVLLSREYPEFNPGGSQ